jgi:DNA-binding response OmpR family regulator
MPDPSVRSDKARRVVLLIDEDPAIGRLARLSVNGPACEVVVCGRHLDGLRLAARQKPDLILMETQFKGMDGLNLASKLLQAPETRGSALAFLTSQPSIVQRFRAIQIGALDYILKPIEGRKLAARVQGILVRLEARRGPVSGPAVDPLLQRLVQLEAESASGVLELERPGQAARLVFSAGELQQAECGLTQGEEALNEVASCGDWTFVFQSSDDDLDTTDDNSPLRKRRTTDQTRPEVPLTKPVKHVPSSLTATVMDIAVAQPRRESPVVLPGFGDSVEDETIVDAGQGGSAPPPAADLEVVIQPIGSSTDKLQALTDDDDNVRTLPPGSEGFKADGFKVATDPGVHPALSDDPPTGEIYDEDAPTAMSFKALDGVDDLSLQKLSAMLEAEAQTDDTSEIPEVASPPRQDATAPTRPPAAALKAWPTPGGVGTPPRGGTPTPSRQVLRQWLTSVSSPLLLVIPSPPARQLLQRAVEEMGFQVVNVGTGVEAYTTALRTRPVALVADLRGPSLDGRELLAAVRSDFHVRETPFIIVSSEYLLSQVQAGGPMALGPILHGLESALAPRVNLQERLRPDQGEITGWVEPIGTAYLLRVLGHAGLSGRLDLKTRDVRQAEVIFRRGEICGATVNTSEPTVGPLAMLHVLGLEWQEYTFLPDVVDGGQVPLGDLGQLIETACQQNNILLARLYQHGVKNEDVLVDGTTLDLYLGRLPQASLELLVKLMEGTPAVTLAEAGQAAPGLLKSILHDLRRKGVLLPTSMRAVRTDGDKPAKPISRSKPRSGRRWLVIVLTGLLTVLLAVGGYLVYWRVLSKGGHAPGTSAGTGVSAPK